MKNICRASGIHVNKWDEYSHPVKANSVRDLAGTYFIVINICCAMISAWGPSHIHDVQLHQTYVHCCQDLIVYLKTQCIAEILLLRITALLRYKSKVHILSSSINDLLKRQAAQRFCKYRAIRLDQV